VVTVGVLLGEATGRLRAAGSESPRLDAEVLLANVLGMDRTGVLAHPESPVGDSAAARFDEAIRRRQAGEPVAYVRGLQEFLGLAFATDARALVPRPETEHVVELAEAEIVRRLTRSPRPAGSPPIRVADVGTGTGAIAVALAVHLRTRRMAEEVDILAVDDAAGALQLALENAVAHAVGDRIRFVMADLVPPGEAPFDVILANLPYVATDALDRLPPPVTFEPRHALDGGPDGLGVIQRLVALLPEVLAQRGVAFFEIGADQRAGMIAVVEDLPGRWSCVVDNDLAGLPRIARVER